MTHREYLIRLREMTAEQRWLIAMHLTEYERKRERAEMRSLYPQMTEEEFQKFYVEDRLKKMRQSSEEKARIAFRM
jgi:hypothetical protein